MTRFWVCDEDEGEPTELTEAEFDESIRFNASISFEYGEWEGLDEEGIVSMVKRQLKYYGQGWLNGMVFTITTE